jgi:hypothetical protein
MAQDYIFPPRRFVDGEPLDTSEVNEAILDAAERLNVGLGPHCIQAPIPTSVVAEADTFTRTIDRFVEVDSGLGPSSAPQRYALGGFSVGQETSWQVIAGPTEDRDLAVDITTGKSNLVVTASVSHCYQGKADGEVGVMLVQVFAEYPDRMAGDDAFVVIVLGGVLHFVYLSIPSGTSDRNRSEKIARLIASGGSVSRGPRVDWQALEWTARAVGRKVFFSTMAPRVITSATHYAIGSTGPSRPIIVLSREIQTAGSTAATVEGFDTLPSYKYVASARAEVVYYPAQVQYGFRVDGAVYPATPTGRVDNEQLSWQPARILAPRENASLADMPINADPTGITGPTLARWKDRPDAINVPMHTHRLTATIPVEPGTHRVETVVRRVPCGPNRSFRLNPVGVGTTSNKDHAQPSDNDLVVYQRQMSVTESPIEPMTAAVFDEAVTVDSFEDQDVVSRASLYEDRLVPLADASNTIKSYQVARGAINGEHLSDYSVVLAVGQANGAADSLSSAAYPYNGYPGADVTALSFGGRYNLYGTTAATTVSWKLIAAATLSREVVGSFLNPLNCLINVQANVAIKKLRPQNATQTEMHLSAGVFAIGLYIDDTGSGTYKWRLWRPSIAWSNSNKYFARQPGKTTKTSLTLEHLSTYADYGAGDHDDIPVTATFVLSGMNALQVKIAQVALFGCATHMTSTAEVAEVGIDRSSLNVVVTKS